MQNIDRSIKYKILTFLIVLIIIFSLMIIYNNYYQVKEKYRYQFTVMGTFASATFYGEPDKIRQAAKTVQKTFQNIEKICSTFNKDSELFQLNKTAYNAPFKCSDTLWKLLLESKSFYDISEGAFDITAKPLMTLWGFYRKRKQLPNQSEIKKVLKKVGLNKVIFDLKKHTVKFTVKGMSFDLGGIAKGYAVDLAAEAVHKLDIRTGTINLGGNIRCLELPPPNKKSYTIGIKNPIHKIELCGTIRLLNSSIATSGNYERYIVLNNKRYTHIMNTITGQPVEGILSVTVVTPIATYADALSTSIFIKSSESSDPAFFAKKVCQQLPGTSVLIIKTIKGSLHKIEIIKVGSIWKNIESIKNITK